MALCVPIETSFGIYDCWIDKTTHTEKPWYAIEIKLRDDLGKKESTPFTHSFFNMYTDDSGIPKVLSYSKYPLNIYWKELERELGNLLLSVNIQQHASLQ